MGLPVEILKKVKLLEISTRKLVNNIFSGEYHSAYKGQGMTFSEFREYIPGDDVRSISWPLTARTGKPFIKIYEEEREMTLLLVVDVSGSSEFGSGTYFKGEVMNHLAALLGFAAMKNNDPIGLLLFSDQVEHFVPPKKGRGQVHRILRDLYYYKPRSKGTSLSNAFSHLMGVLKKKANIFIFSDFLDENYEHSLKQLGQKHDVACIVVKDELESKLPEMGLVDFYDAESEEVVTVDTSSGAFQRHYEKEQKMRLQKRDELLKKAQVSRVEITSGEDFVAPLISYFKRRNKR